MPKAIKAGILSSIVYLCPVVLLHCVIFRLVSNKFLLIIGINILGDCGVSFALC